MRRSSISNNKSPIKKETFIFSLGILAIVVVLFYLAYQFFDNKKTNISTATTVNSEVTNEEFIHSDAKYKKIIEDFVKAEDNRDLQKLAKLFVLNNITYFNNSNITKSEVLSKYERIWKDSHKAKNEILSIDKINHTTYNYTTKFIWTDIHKQQKETISTLQIQFFNDKIKSVVKLN